MPRLSAFALGAVSALALLAAPASARPAPDPQFATFVPSQNPNNDRIDYEIWNEAMKNIVISMGPSLRETAGRPDPSFGTRRQYGHDSRYRLEGTRVMFSFFDDAVRNSFTEYRQDLERTASAIDIQKLSRNEQLAYWVNLHNVAMVEQIAKAWPVRQPRELLVDGVRLHDSKFITVEGVAMSPRDIREKIVYANWTSPEVVYGFWHGEIGSPSLQREAFTGENVADLLDKGARDFVNSLRGSQKRGDTLQVSELYREVAPYYFPDFRSDIRAHIAKHADTETNQILSVTQEVEASVAEYDIADLAGGAREPTYSNVTNGSGMSNSFRVPQSMGRLLAQREQKFDKILREGRTGTVTFSNIKLPGDPEDKDEVE